MFQINASDENGPEMRPPTRTPGLARGEFTNDRSICGNMQKPCRDVSGESGAWRAASNVCPSAVSLHRKVAGGERGQ